MAGPCRFYHGRPLVPREHVILAEPDEEGTSSPLAGGRVIPVYPATEGLSHKVIRGLIGRHLDDLIALSSELLRLPHPGKIGGNPRPDTDRHLRALGQS